MKNDTKAMIRNPMFIVVGLVSAWVIITFMILPNINLLRMVFEPKAGMSAIEKLMASEPAKRSLINSVLLAVVLSVTVNIVGIFIVLVTRFYAVVGSRILYLGYATTLIYGGVVLVSGYKFLYGSNGFLTRILSTIFPSLDPGWFTGFFAVVFVMTFATTGNHLLFLTAAITKIDYQTIEAAKQMGASDWKILRTVVLPVLKPTIFALTVLTFIGGLGALAAPQIVGGRSFQTISPMILTFASAPQSRDLAATLALILGVLTFALLLVLNILEKKGTYFSVSKVSATLVKQRIDNPILNVVIHVLAYLFFILYVIPPFLITLFSFTDASSIASASLSWDAFTIENYARVFTDYSAAWPFLVSIGYSAAAAIIVIAFIMFVARIVTRYQNFTTSVLEYLLHIPWVMPGVMTALALIVVFSSPNILVGNKVLTGTLVILLIAYVIGRIPFTLRILKASFMGVNSNLEEAASMLGAGEIYTFRRILIPLVIPPAAAITALNFNSMLDDYDQAIFLANPFYQPLGIFIKNATQGETIGDATALTFVYAVILMLISTLTMYVVYGRGSRVGRQKVR